MHQYNTHRRLCTQTKRIASAGMSKNVQPYIYFSLPDSPVIKVTLNGPSAYQTFTRHKWKYACTTNYAGCIVK